LAYPKKPFGQTAENLGKFFLSKRWKPAASNPMRPFGVPRVGGKQEGGLLFVGEVTYQHIRMRDLAGAEFFREM
jgi:hypothetical protein